MSSDKGSGACRLLEFRGREYKVEINIDNNVHLIVQIDDCISFDRWIGKYDTSYIEELTHKTGNFKQFGIFCNMLESALTQNTDAVSLDLLTFDDLNALREQKIGNQSKQRKSKSSENKYKRYLIMTYTAEFDQIHYPLPLAYLGKSDPLLIKKQTEDLKHKVDLRTDSDYISSNFSKNNYELLLIENENLKQELKSCYQQLKEVDVESVLKDMKVLKKVIHNLENDLLTERNKHSRMMIKKKKDYDQLLEEFEELKATERNFRIRCKNLTEELAALKRNSRLSPVVACVSSTKLRNNNCKAPYSSNKYNRETSLERGRKGSFGSSNIRRSSQESITKDKAFGQVRSRTSSTERCSAGRRTPSPNFIKFDPSAYVKGKEKKRRQLEINLSRRRTPSSNSKNRTTYTSVSKPPAGRINDQVKNYVQRHHQKQPSIESDDGSVNRSRSSAKKYDSKRNRNSYISDLSEDEIEKPQQLRGKSVSRSPVVKKYLNNQEESNSIGIADIDARLAALQKFMENNLD